MILTAAALIVGLAGVALAARYYWELRKWAKQCQNARIAIAYNRRVQLDAPLTDWLTWANMLEKDEKSNGRVVYRNGKTSVAILRPGAAGRATGKTEVQTVKPNTRRTGNGALEVAP